MVLLRAFISSLIMPLTIFWLLLLCGLMLMWLKKKNNSRILMVIALIWFAFVSFSPLPNLLIGSLERSYPPLTDVSSLSTDTAVHIMVLGSGHISDPALPANNQLSRDALGRLAEGIRLHRILPGSKLITSGWQGDDPVPTALVLKKVAISLGVSPQDILTLVTPVNTEEEALCYRSEFGKGHKLIVVTDAAHMPRAIIWFRKAGLNPIAAPTNHLIKRSPNQKSFNFLPSADYIHEVECAIHEYIGILWAKLNCEDKYEGIHEHH